MKTRFLFSILIIATSLSKNSNAQTGIDDYQESIERFIEGYNNQQYRTVKKSFGFLAKIFATKKSIMGNYLSPRYAKYGKILKLEEPVKAGERTYVFPIIYEKDSTIPEYLALSFTKNHKIISLYYSPDNLIYPRIDSTVNLVDLVEPYKSFKDHKHLQLSIGIYNNGTSTFYAFNGDSASHLPTDSTLYQIGSVTKLFTGILYANSINNNHVDSTAVLSKYIGEKITYKEKEANLTQLAQHTSGLPREPNNLDLTITDAHNPFSNYTNADLDSFLKTARLNTAPGNTYAYSNTGMGLLAYILSSVRESTFEKLLQQEICTPLKMGETTTSPDTTLLSQTVKSYYRGTPTSDFTFQEPLIGAGGIYSSTRDMLKFIEANITPDSTSISNDLILAQTPRKVDKFITLGYAWEISSITISGELIEVFEHSGNTLGASSILFLSKKKNIGIIVMANSGIPVDELGTKIFMGLLKKHL
jgi:CubicO group peptidase (beta-lactamase class C family)